MYSVNVDKLVKTSETPAKYPRNYGQIKKKPLQKEKERY